jgi:23S rRNA (uracil1939-C5)-methyltransferase
MQQGALIEVEIEKAVFRGLSLARHDGQVILVRGGYPGERWRVRILEAGRQYLRAEAEEALRTVSGRRASACPWFPECGGCSYQDLNYAEQLALKRAVLADALARAKVAQPEPIEIIASPERGWRMRASLHVRGTDRGVCLGLTASASHRVIDFDVCAQLSSRANAVVDGLRAVLRKEPDLAGRMQRVEIAESQAGDRLVAAFAGELSVRDQARLAGIAGALPGLDGLGAVVQQGPRRRFASLAGQTHVGATVREVALQWHVLSFFQANRFLLEALVSEVARGIPAGGTLLDLYGGVGLFALPLAAQAERVVCVEGDPIAAEDARVNAQRAGRSNVRVLQAEVLRALGSEPTSPDERIVLDPPRTGLGKGVVQAIVLRRPAAIVYVSCDPPTLGRDLAQLAAAGYRAQRMTALDLFPNTFHVETVVHLTRAG